MKKQKISAKKQHPGGRKIYGRLTKRKPFAAQPKVAKIFLQKLTLIIVPHG